MAKYTSVSISGYNATPPSDDGTVSESNKVKWSTEKTKLTDPIKTALESINTNLVSAFDVGPTALITNTTLGTSHYGDFIQVSGAGVTLTLTDAATLGAGWYCEVVNTDSTNTVTIGRATGGDTINGTAENINLLPYQSISIFVNASANGFIITAKRTHSKTNTVAETYVFNGDVNFTEGLGPSYSKNYSIQATVGSSALTITLSDYAGNALSSTNKARFTFRNATAGTGTSTVVDATANMTLVISSGSTLGTTSALASRTWIVLFNDAGTLRLGAINCSTATALYSLSDDVLASSTAEGGAGGADSAGVIYTGTAVTTKAMRVLGYIESTQATAGTWATTPSKVQLWQNGMKLPGDVVQISRTATGEVATGTTTVPVDDSIPQNTEGDQYMTVSISPKSEPNILRISSRWIGANTAANDTFAVSIFQDTTANALATSAYTVATASFLSILSVDYMKIATSTASTTFKIRAGVDNGGTTTFNGASSTRRYGGAMNSFLEVVELMG